MNKNIILFIFMFCTNSLVFAQDDFYGSFGDREDDKLILEMVSHFEKTLCDHYNIQPNKSSNAFKKYIEDISKEDVKFATFLAKLANDKSLNLLKESHDELFEYVWIKSSDNRHKLSSLSFTPFTPEQIKAFEDEEYFNEFVEKIQAQEFVYILNYEETFGNKIIQESNNQNIKDFIITFRENYINHPLLIAPLLNLTDEEYENQAVKIFIAFEFFYTCLNSKVAYE